MEILYADFIIKYKLYMFWVLCNDNTNCSNLFCIENDMLGTKGYIRNIVCVFLKGCIIRHDASVMREWIGRFCHRSVSNTCVGYGEAKKHIVVKIFRHSRDKKLFAVLIKESAGRY